MLISARTERAFSPGKVGKDVPVYLEKQIRAVFHDDRIHGEMERKRDIRRDKLQCVCALSPIWGK